jgi:hypothetical protein
MDTTRTIPLPHMPRDSSFLQLLQAMCTRTFRIVIPRCSDYNRVPMLDHLFLICSAIAQNDIQASSILKLVDTHDLMVESDMGTKSGKFEVLITKSR